MSSRKINKTKFSPTTSLTQTNNLNASTISKIYLHHHSSMHVFSRQIHHISPNLLQEVSREPLTADSLR